MLHSGCLVLWWIRRLHARKTLQPFKPRVCSETFSRLQIVTHISYVNHFSPDLTCCFKPTSNSLLMGVSFHAHAMSVVVLLQTSKLDNTTRLEIAVSRAHILDLWRVVLLWKCFQSSRHGFVILFLIFVHGLSLRPSLLSLLLGQIKQGLWTSPNSFKQ